LKKIIYKARIELKGITPILMHKCGLIETNKKTDSDTDYDNEWIKSVYTSMSDKNKVIVPSLNIEAMLRDAAPGIKIGSKIFLSKIITPGADIVGFENDLLYKNNIITIDDIRKNDWLFACAVVIKKNRVTRIRVCIPDGWGIKFNMNVYDKAINDSTLRSLIEKAGDKEGLMDWRPGSPKPGKFGQFELDKFEVV